MNADDVRAMLAAGADLVQLYTGFIYEGPDLAGNICRALIADAEAAQAAETGTDAGAPADESPLSTAQTPADARQPEHSDL